MAIMRIIPQTSFITSLLVLMMTVMIIPSRGDRISPFWLSPHKMTFEKAACYCRQAGGQLARVTALNLAEITRVMERRGDFEQAWCDSWNGQRVEFLLVTERRGSPTAVNRADLNFDTEYLALCQHGCERDPPQIVRRRRMRTRMRNRSRRSDLRDSRDCDKRKKKRKSFMTVFDSSKEKCSCGCNGRKDKHREDPERKRTRLDRNRNNKRNLIKRRREENQRRRRELVPRRRPLPPISDETLSDPFNSDLESLLYNIPCDKCSRRGNRHSRKRNHSSCFRCNKCVKHCKCKGKKVKREDSPSPKRPNKNKNKKKKSCSSSISKSYMTCSVPLSDLTFTLVHRSQDGNSSLTLE